MPASRHHRAGLGRRSAVLPQPGQGFTLRVYTHLLPSSEDRTRRAIDRALGHTPDIPAGPETA